ncbi:PREDICTED: polypeptide N-acetylgalactosaminyltransferase 14-like [Poecilia mexicana]|uniref:polypeptide N-acetylgalactosaminyltransferase 14-like n=1 Tax=Poecilia mexicana TaxID=48701 RepID=UPI00072DD297|nr:PREDICTED: polypeptide N-acetylgalactosaminyltransferase 14-like [Poecilia mexicana]
MKRLCRRLAVAVAVLVWLGALVYLLVLSRRKLPELGAGAGAAAGGGETGNNQISDAEWEDMLEGFDERSYLNARRWKPGDDPYTLYAFNQRESERIPSDRALRDTRHFRYATLRFINSTPLIQDKQKKSRCKTSDGLGSPGLLAGETVAPHALLGPKTEKLQILG